MRLQVRTAEKKIMDTHTTFIHNGYDENVFMSRNATDARKSDVHSLVAAQTLLCLYRIVIFHINDLIFLLRKFVKKNCRVWSHSKEKKE